jgi:superfamily II DNA or RNA helicase
VSTPQTMMRPRPYQSDAVQAVFRSWREGMQRPAVVMATGLGKTVVFSHLADRFFRTQKGILDSLRVRPSGAARVVILVHRDELADQTLAKLAAVAPGLGTGKVKAEDDDVTAEVMVCSVQTLARENRIGRLLDARAYAGDIGLVIVDECHHALADSYRNVLALLGCYDPDSPTVAVGFTATLARGDGRGLGDVWQDAVFTRSTLWGISQGHLTDVRSRKVDVEALDLSRVTRSRGDWTAKSLGQALTDSGVPELLPQVIAEHAADRRSIIVFTPTVAVAQAVSEALDAHGVPSGYVHGGTPREDRLRLYERFRTGTVRVLVNCMVLTEGADFPFADCAVIARPTSSETLFIQMIGRVLRPSPATGKKDALVLLLSDGTASIRTLVDLEPDVSIPVLDGESLTEAYDRQEQIREEQEARHRSREEARPRSFRFTHKEVDLFAASPAYQWLRTDKGVQFIPLGTQGELLLWPSDGGLWDVVWAPAVRGEKWVRLHTGLELGMAMAWAESEADERSDLNTSKAASWRRKPASDRQISYARTLGRPLSEGARAGEAGDVISVALASRKIDRFAR